MRRMLARECVAENAGVAKRLTYSILFVPTGGHVLIRLIWEKMKIEHVALYVNDLESARAFFVTYLGGVSNDGYHNTRTGFRSYFISFENGARLELMFKPEMRDDPKAFNRTGYAHLAFSVGSREKVDEITGRIKEAGYELISGPRTTGDGYYESCIAAVEGNQIEITV